MTEYIFSKKGKEIKKVRCSEAFAASIALQAGCDYRVYIPEKKSPEVKEKTSREEKLVTKIKREMPEKDKSR